MLEKFFKKFKTKKGLTGADIAVSIVLIVLTMGVVTAIYINTINKSRENIRHANATRIATNLAEKIQDIPYDLVIANGNYSSSGNDGKVYGVTIPSGYKVDLKQFLKYGLPLTLSALLTGYIFIWFVWR